MKKIEKALIIILTISVLTLCILDLTNILNNTIYPLFVGLLFIVEFLYNKENKTYILFLITGIMMVLVGIFS